MKSTNVCQAMLLVWLLMTPFLATAQQGSALTAQDVVDSLSVYDEELLRSMEIRFSTTQPTHFDVSLGNCKTNAFMQSTGGSQVLQTTVIQMDPLVYKADDPNSSYDALGRQIISHEQVMTVLLGDADWRVRRDPEQITIGGDGKKSVPHITLSPRMEIYSPGSHDPANLYFRNLLGMGRGYAQLIAKAKSIKIDEWGVATVTAEGTLFSDHLGTWELEVDCKNQYLTRKADFTPLGSVAPSFRVSAAGVYHAPIMLYSAGTVNFSNGYVIRVTLDHYTAIPDAALGRRIIDHAQEEAGLPEKTLTMDFRDVDGDGIPLTYFKAAKK